MNTIKIRVEVFEKRAKHFKYLNSVLHRYGRVDVRIPEVMKCRLTASCLRKVIVNRM